MKHEWVNIYIIHKPFVLFCFSICVFTVADAHMHTGHTSLRWLGILVNSSRNNNNDKHNPALVCNLTVNTGKTSDHNYVQRTRLHSWTFKKAKNWQTDRHTHTHKHAHPEKHAHKYTHMRARPHTHTNTHTHKHTHTHTHTHTHHTHTHHTHTHAHARTHARTHTHTHTHTHTQERGWKLSWRNCLEIILPTFCVDIKSG